MWVLLGKLLGGLVGGVSKVLPNREPARTTPRARINEAEVSGSAAQLFTALALLSGMDAEPALRLGSGGTVDRDSFALSGLGKTLPPSALDQIMALLLGMLGLGF